MDKYGIQKENESGLPVDRIGDYKPKKKKVRRSDKHYFLTFWENLAGMKIDFGKMCFILGSMGIDNVLILSSGLCKRTCDALGISKSVYYKLLSTMVSANLMLRLSRGSYFVNPRYFAKLRLEDIDAAIKRYNDLFFYEEQKKFNAKKKSVKKEIVPDNIIKLPKEA